MHKGFAYRLCCVTLEDVAVVNSHREPSALMVMSSPSLPTMP